MGADGAVIQLVTRCASAEEFIERFARFTTETHVIVPALPHVAVGSNGPFEICLRDRSVMMKGRCEVTEVRRASAPPLMRIRLREMDAHSCGVHLRLMERHAATARPPVGPAPAPLPRPEGEREAVPVAAPPAADASVTVVDGARPPSDTETTAVSPLPRPEVRAPGAAFTLPANPLSDLDASDLAGFIDATMLEADGTAVVAPVGIGGAWRAALRARAAALPPHLAVRLDRARRLARRWGPYAAILLVGILVGAALRHGSTPAAPVVRAPGPAPSAPAVTPPSSPSPTLAAADAPSPPSPALAAADEIPDPAPRNCIARVKTRPAGAAVFWGDIALGASPIKHAAIPCGTATVTLRREHYVEVTRTIRAKRGRNVVVAQRLRREPGKVVAAATPRPRAATLPATAATGPLAAR